MIRTFDTHQVRKQRELTGRLWEFSPCEGEHVGETYQVAVPSCWETYPEFTDYRGKGRYKCSFNAGGSIRLECKGVSHTAEVYLDGKKIAEHYNAYTSFDVICQDLAQGEHELEIVADNGFSEKSALHVPNDYMSYGGVSRPVVLEELRELYIRQFHITPYRQNGKWAAKVELEIRNLTAQEQQVCVSVQIAEKKLLWENATVPVGGLSLTQEMEFDQVKEWSIEQPSLYFATARLSQGQEVIDDLIERFGFREIRTEGKSILINGKKLRFKGLNRHEDHPQFGCALPFAAIQADLELIRHMGANSVRTSHYPNDEIFLDLCDEQGILVWEENHARGLSLESMQNPYFEEQAEQVIREMIPAHYNHPCIYIWGILNECASNTEYGKECYRKQFELVRALDSSRPCSFASCMFKSDISLDLPDVVSFNIYPLWYHDSPVHDYLDELYQWIQNETEGKNKPFLITEIGAGALYGYRAPNMAKWTEDYQATTIEKQLNGVLQYPDCQGVYIWQFCDIRISRECFGARPRTMNNKGIVDEYRRRKLSYDVVKRTFEEYSNYI